MNFGQKFPYALLTFSQKFVEAGYWVHLLPKFVEADCGPHLIPKVCRSWLLATPVPRTHTFSQKLSKLVIGVHYTPIITHTPSSTSTPTPHTNYTPTIHHTTYTPTIHPPYTIPQPTPYPSSCELTATKCGKNR